MGNGDSEDSGAGLYGNLTKSRMKTYVLTSAADTSIDVDSLSDSERGEKGFGSSGK